MKSKKILLFIIALIGSFIINIKGVFALNIDVKNVKLNKKGGNISLGDISFSDKNINSSIVFNDLNDYVIYQITLKNNDKEDYTIDSIKDNVDNENIDVSYSYDNKKISSKGTKNIYVTLKYNKKLYNKDSISLNDLTITLNLLDSKGNSGSATINPTTGDNIKKYTLLFIASLILILFGLLLIKRRKSKGFLILLLALIPTIVIAKESLSFSIKFTNITIKGEMLPYTVTIMDSNGNPTERTVLYGNPIGELPEATKTGYTFDKYEDQDGNKVTKDTVVKGNLTVTPKFNIVTYDIEYDYSGGFAVNPGHYTVEDEITLNNPTRAGYTFAGYTGSNGDNKQTSVTISHETGNKSYTAHWSTNQDTPYRVIHRYPNLDGTYEEVVQNLTGPTDEEVTPGLLPKEGFEGPTTLKTITINASELQVVTYTYKRIDCTLTINNDIETTFTNPTYPYGTKITLTAKDKEYYNFTGWSNGETTKTITFNITGPTNYYPEYERIKYTVTYNPNGGTINPGSVEVDAGTSISTLPIPNAPTGKSFEAWYTAQTGGTKVNNGYTPTRDVEIFARYYTDISGATVTPNSIDIYIGNNSTITVTDIEEEYTFTSNDTGIATVNSNGVVTGVSEGTTTITITGTKSGKTKTIDVTVIQPKYTVTYNANGGTVSPTSEEVNAGSSIPTLPTPTAPSNKEFAGWYTGLTDGTKITSPYTPTGDIELFARYQDPTSFTVTFNTNGGSSIASQTVDVGGKVTRPTTNPTKSGNTFVDWYTDDTYQTVFDFENTTINKATTIYALFLSNSYVAEMNGTGYYSITAALDEAGDTTSTIRLLKNTSENVVIESDQNITLNLNGNTLSDSDDIVILNNGILNITNGTITSDASIEVVKNTASGTLNITNTTINVTSNSTKNGVLNYGGTAYLGEGTYVTSISDAFAAVQNESNGTTTIDGIRVEASGKRQAVYNNTGTIEIKGNSILSGTPYVESSNKRAAVQNNKGTMKITGGTIISNNYGVTIQSGTLIIGTDDSDNLHNVTSPEIRGGVYGVQSTINYSFYDGIIEGETAAVNDESKITKHETGLEIVNEDKVIDSDTYHTLYYSSGDNRYVVTLNPNGGTVSPTQKSITVGQAVGTLPTPTAPAGKTFIGWYTQLSNGEEVTSSYMPNVNKTIYARYYNDVSGATVAPSSINVLKDATDTISISNVEEEYTFTSNNTNIATVDSTGKVTGKGVGTTTITITGTTSGKTKTVNVTVESSTYTVTLNPNGGTLTTTSITKDKGVAVGTLPTPTAPTGKEFDGWYTELTDGTKVTSSYTPNANITIYARYIDPCKTFSTDSWTTIRDNLESDSSYYAVGCEKEVELDMDDDGTNESYTVRIANTSTPEVCSTEGYSQTACGTVIEFVDVVGMRQMNSSQTNAGGWKQTAMVTYLNGDFYNKLPVDLKSIIIPTYPIVSGSGRGEKSDNITEVDVTNNKIYLLSGREVGLEHSRDNKKDETTDTRSLDYYLINMTKEKRDIHGANQKWWLRSAMSDTNNQFIRINVVYDGLDPIATYSFGVAPAFRIGTMPEFTVSFNTDGGSSVASQPITYGEKATRPTTNPTKSGYTFENWYTDDTYQTVFDFDNTVITGATTIYAHFEKLKVCAENENITTLSSTTCSNNENITVGDGIVCKRAVKLHEETCSQTSTSIYCSGAGYTTSGSKGTSTITYGSCGTSGTLSSGDAFTCDVNGDGEFDELVERFYYLSDYYNTSSKTFENDTAVLIYYNNVTSGVSCNNNVYLYCASANSNRYGPLSIRYYLPTTLQWSNVELKNTTRAILAEYKTTHDSATTPGGTLPTNFSYEGYSARFLTAKELMNGCGLTQVNDFGEGELESCNYLMENTRFSKKSLGSFGYWLETPNASDSNSALSVDTAGRLIRAYAVRYISNGIRPVIEVPKTKISY